MFKVGDIVRPKKGFIGHNYCFKIIEVEMNPFDDNTYKLQGIKQDLDPLLGSTSRQVSIIDNVEELWWKEKHIELTSTVKLRYDIPNIKMSDYNDIVLEKMEKEILKLNDKVKEEKEMDILDLYKERKNELLMNEFYKNRHEIIEEDEIQKIKNEMINQINIILDNEGSNEKFETLVPGLSKIITTKQTEEKLNKIEMELDSEKDKLYNTIQEVKALFELTDDYNERMKILKRYDIINKNGKLNI